MPYIKQIKRSIIDKQLEPILEFYPDEGELNYIITKLLLSYLHKRGLRYATFNSMIGVLECAKQELYRRSVGLYEDKKIEENGDVY